MAKNTTEDFIKSIEQKAFIMEGTSLDLEITYQQQIYFLTNIKSTQQIENFS
ncbi:hypothetical protein [Brevibacillus laterosporus]|uniref:hypothetical protein n=1 Tax=Brevibacillus laterosporus TaxID=1465 RepID=UPI003D1C8D2A